MGVTAPGGLLSPPPPAPQEGHDSSWRGRWDPCWPPWSPSGFPSGRVALLQSRPPSPVFAGLTHDCVGQAARGFLSLGNRNRSAARVWGQGTDLLIPDQGGRGATAAGAWALL